MNWLDILKDVRSPELRRILGASKGKSVANDKRGFYIFARAQRLHAIYVLAAPGHPYSKVGIADEPSRRLMGVQGGNWNKLKLHKHWWVMDAKLSKRVEQEVLSRLAEHNERGEWLKLPPQTVAETVEAAATDLNIGLMGVEELLPVAREWHQKGLGNILLTDKLRF